MDQNLCRSSAKDQQTYFCFCPHTSFSPQLQTIIFSSGSSRSAPDSTTSSRCSRDHSALLLPINYWFIGSGPVGKKQPKTETKWKNPQTQIRSGKLCFFIQRRVTNLSLSLHLSVISISFPLSRSLALFHSLSPFHSLSVPLSLSLSLPRCLPLSLSLSNRRLNRKKSQCVKVEVIWGIKGAEHKTHWYYSNKTVNIGSLIYLL